MGDFHRFDRDLVRLGIAGAERDDPADARYRAQQPDQLRLRLDDEVGGKPPQARHEADELESVAEAVKAAQQHLASGERRSVPDLPHMIGKAAFGQPGAAAQYGIAHRPGRREAPREHQAFPVFLGDVDERDAVPQRAAVRRHGGADAAPIESGAGARQGAARAIRRSACVSSRHGEKPTARPRVSAPAAPRLGKICRS